jgi:hypothetical protein
MKYLILSFLILSGCTSHMKLESACMEGAHIAITAIVNSPGPKLSLESEKQADAIAKADAIANRIAHDCHDYAGVK